MEGKIEIDKISHNNHNNTAIYLAHPHAIVCKSTFK